MANNIEIVKPITIEVDGKTYTLEFNRNSVVSAEKAGFRGDLIAEMPMTMIPILFYAAFKMHQPKITQDETNSILFDKIGGASPELIERLSELYAVPTRTLIRKKDDGEPKNVKISL